MLVTSVPTELGTFRCTQWTRGARVGIVRSIFPGLHTSTKTKKKETMKFLYPSQLFMFDGCLSRTVSPITNRYSFHPRFFLASYWFFFNRILLSKGKKSFFLFIFCVSFASSFLKGFFLRSDNSLIYFHLEGFFRIEWKWKFRRGNKSSGFGV